MAVPAVVPEPEETAGPKVAVPLRVTLYLLTVLSAAAALFVEPAIAGAVARRALSPRWLFLPIAVYGLFFLAFVVDRVLLLRRKRYPAARAFFQIAFGIVFASLLLPSTIEHYRGHRPKGVERLLTHADPEVRAAAVYAEGFQGQTKERVAMLAQKLDDKSPEVRDAALVVLSRWSGLPKSDPTGVRAWASALSGSLNVTSDESKTETSRTSTLTGGNR